jgi:glycerol-3-phosphate O-acyltransferase
MPVTSHAHLPPPPSTPPPPPGTPPAAGWLQRFLGGTLHHYPGVLPERVGRLRFTLLKLFYSGVRLEAQQAAALRELPADAIIVFASRFRCAFPFLFAYTRYRLLGLPFPRIGLGCRVLICRTPMELARILAATVLSLWRNRRLPDPGANGYYRDQLLAGQAGFLTLLHAPGRLRRLFHPRSADPVEFLITLQKTTDRPVLVVPQVVFFSRSPHRARPSVLDMLFGPEDEPGRLRLLALLFKKAGNVFVELSPPVHLQRFLARPDLAGHPVSHQAAILRRETLAQIQRHRRSITGPVLTPRAELKQRILDSDRCQDLIQSHAEANGLPPPEVRASVAACIDEIAADLRPNWIRFYSGPIGFMLNTLFDGVSMNTEGLAAVKRMSLHGPVVYVPCHKSHADYLILSYMLYHHDLPCPLVAAGKNLSFWPLGPLFRRGGAFFIRRSFRGAVLYSRAFSEYVHAVLQEGHSIEQFIEGGRSRSGKLLMPKLGLLSILLTALHNGACEDLIFVPVSIGYDRVLEEKSYLQEIEGGQKQPENIWQVLKARKFLRRRHGKVYLQFDHPLSAIDLARSAGTDLRSMEPDEFNGFCRSLAHRIVCGIDRVTVVTPHALTAAAILSLGHDRFSLQEILSAVAVCAAHLDAVGAKSADTLVLDHRRAVVHAMGSYVQRRILESTAGEAAGADAARAEFLVREARRPVLEYYKNTCVSFFIPAAIVALAILQRDAFQFAATDLQTDVEFLQELFRLEFTLDSDTSPQERLRDVLRIFQADAVLVPHPTLPDTLNLTSAGFRKLKFFARFLKTFLESYWVVLTYLNSEPEPEDPKDRLKKIAALGNRMYRQKEIDHREALSKVTYENALGFFHAHGIRGAQDRGTIDAFAAVVRRALRCLAAAPGRPLEP